MAKSLKISKGKSESVHRSGTDYNGQKSDDTKGVIRIRTSKDRLQWAKFEDTKGVIRI